MGECGCGSDIEEYAFPGPDGDVYTIGRFIGCEQCQGTAIVIVRLADEQRDWAKHLPPMPEAWFGGAVLPLIDVDKLHKLLVERCTFGSDDDDYRTLDDALHDQLRNAVEEAVFAADTVREAGGNNG
jgi:hypothetical protein